MRLNLKTVAEEKPGFCIGCYYDSKQFDCPETCRIIWVEASDPRPEKEP